MINVGIIGVGYWGPNYARLCFELEEINLKWCADLNESALFKMRQRYPSVKITTDYNKILSDSSVDAVIIVVPAGAHFAIARDALAARKNVLIEKPLTDDLREARKLKSLVNKSKKILMVDHIFKFNAVVEKLKELIDHGELGKICYISASYTALGPIRKDVDAMWDLAPHWIYVVDYLLESAPTSISANGGQFLKSGVNDVVFINMVYPKNVIVNIHVSWLYPQKVRGMAIVGDKKMAVFDDVSPDIKLSLYDKGVSYSSQDVNFADLQLVIRDGDVWIPKIVNKEPLKESLKHFLKCVQGNQKPIADVNEGLEVVGILDAARKSMKNNGVSVQL